MRWNYIHLSFQLESVVKCASQLRLLSKALDVSDLKLDNNMIHSKQELVRLQGAGLGLDIKESLLEAWGLILLANNQLDPQKSGEHELQKSFCHKMWLLDIYGTQNKILIYFQYIKTVTVITSQIYRQNQNTICTASMFLELRWWWLCFCVLNSHARLTEFTLIICAETGKFSCHLGVDLELYF